MSEPSQTLIDTYVDEIKKIDRRLKTDGEMREIEAVAALCRLLTELGYAAVVKVFEHPE